MRLPPLERTSGNSVGTAVLGAGPAGLSAAHVLSLRGAQAAVFEADGSVGGIAKTIEFQGYRFDLGGHRFFTKLRPIERLWREAIGDDFLLRPRLSRIYYRGRYLAYPLAAWDVVSRLGLIESLRCTLSYARSRVTRPRDPATFEEWVTSRFGKRLYDAFFRSYTEKVWGIPGDEIMAEWAAQRIKDFSLAKAVLRIFGIGREHATLIEEFHYPRLGPGQMWEAFRRRVEDRGIPVHLNHRCVAIRREGMRATSIVVRSNGSETELPVDAILSSIPLRDLIEMLEPAPPEEVRAAAGRLRYRDFVLVALMMDDAEPFPDNWIYLHDPGTRAGRVQNFGAWSESMVRPGTTCLGVEYFCFQGDEVWEMPERQTVEMAIEELARIGLIDPARVVDGVKVRVPKAYPMYDRVYTEVLPVVREWIDGMENLHTFGRNGLHRYNNQDHSMWTAILATLNLLDDRNYDVWSVNADRTYLEEGVLLDGLVELVPD
ncbi:MAG: NAD(P)/FAD-dependent oxidoreductase [Gaiellaceae bacterium]